MDKITTYYSLCRIVAHPLRHIVNNRTARALFSDRELELFFRERDGVYTVREDVVGGARVPWWQQRTGGGHRAIIIGAGHS